MENREKLRVCFVSDSSEDLTGGARSQAGLMRELAGRGVSPFFVSHMETVQTENARRRGYPTAVIPARLYVCPRGKLPIRSRVMVPVKLVYNGLQRRKMERFLRENRIEIVHINSLFSCTDWALAARHCGIPCVWHIREYLGDDHGFVVRGKHRFYRALRGAERRVAISGDIRDYWEKELSAPCTVIYNGLEPEIYTGSAEEKFRKPVVTCAMVGRVKEQKGQMTAIRAVERIAQSGGPDVRLKIIGNRDRTDFEREIKAYVRDRNLEGRVEILPFLDDVNAALQDCDVGILASLREAFGRVTIEYKMAGLLAVGTDSGGTRELIHDGEDGLLFPPEDDQALADLLLRMAENRDLARNLAARGQRQARDQFSLGRTADRVRALYEEVLTERNSRR